MDVTGRFTHGEYHTLDTAIKQVMRRSAGDAVMLGYLLRRMMDERLWTSQYSSLDAYLREELHMDYTQACRFEAINRKYSVNGHSKDIDAKWEDYSQGVLIEMLNMTPELEEKVTPDMTVRQVREIKRQARQEKEKEKVGAEALTGEGRLQTGGNCQETPEEPDWNCRQDNGCREVSEQHDIPDAEFREVDLPVEAAVQRPEPERQGEAAGQVLVPVKVATSQHPEPDRGITDELAEVKGILAGRQKMLDDFLEASKGDGSVLETQMYKQLAIIVSALTEMLRRMEDEETGPEPGERGQPPLPPLKNNDQRREWLNSYKDWGLWYRDENIGVEYYKFDFDNGARLIAEVYREEATKYCDAYESCFLHLVGGPEPPKGKYGVGKWARHTGYSKHSNSETELVEFLKEAQRNG